MLSTRSFSPTRSDHFSSTVDFATSGLICLTLAVFICCLLATLSYAQGPSLSLGTLATNGSPAACNPGDGFYYYNYPGNPPPHYAVYAVDGCGNAEGVTSGTVPGFYPQDFGGNSQGGGNAGGLTAITDDVIGVPSPSNPGAVRA